MKKIFFALTLAMFAVSGIYAQKVAVVTDNKAGWQKIGETTVNFKADRDVVKVWGADAFKAIKIKATDAPVHIGNLLVVYQDGEPDDIPVRFDFKAGTESRPIDLEGKNRRIKQIDMIYKTIPNWKGEKAHIEIWGLK
jgi:hypothetical protein